MCSKEKNIQKYRSFTDYDSSAVYNSLLGTALAQKNLVVLDNHKIIMRRDHKTMIGKVKILAGGGAGLEPAEAGYVGYGMLTAAVLGNICIAPSKNSILVAIRELAFEHSDGVLLLVKNYIGDKLNFGLALESATCENITVRMLLIGDDSSDPNPGKCGRRGLAGSILVYKIAGAMSEAGKSIDDIFHACRESILNDLSTISLTISCSGHLKWEDKDQSTTAVIGLGAYGQPGQTAEYKGLDAAVQCMINALLPEGSDEPIVVLINNLGGTSKFEEAIISTEVMKQLKTHKIATTRLYVGTFMSLLESKGFSLTVLKITSAEILAYLDAPTSAFNWPYSANIQEFAEGFPVDLMASVVGPMCDHEKLDDLRFPDTNFGPSLSDNSEPIVEQILSFAAEALISCEKQINVIDSEVGDGDAGTMLKNGAAAIIESLQRKQINLSFPFKFLHDLSDILDRNIGGTTGALYSIFFKSASRPFRNVEEVTCATWCEALRAGVKAVKFYGKAEVGERTILDALCPAADAFEFALQKNEDIHRIASCVACTSEYYAQETKKLKPYYVRGSYPKGMLLYPDAGAHAAAVWIRAVAEGVKLKFPSV